MKTYNIRTDEVQRGFSAVEVLLIVVVTGILGFTGWYVYQSTKLANKNYASVPSTSTPKSSTSSTPPTDPTANWLLYTSPDGHYSVRLADGWNLTQNCNQALETYYTGNSDPLALKSGTKATVDNQCNGKDGNPILSFEWYDLSDPTQGGQKILDSFNTADNPQYQLSFTTNSGQAVDKYYMKVTTEGDVNHPQVGTYYEYVIKNKAGFVLVFNFYPPANPSVVDRHTVVESAVKTLSLS